MCGDGATGFITVMYEGSRPLLSPSPSSQLPCWIRSHLCSAFCSNSGQTDVSNMGLEIGALALFVSLLSGILLLKMEVQFSWHS